MSRLFGGGDASQRLVQRGESGTTTAPRPVYARALEVVTGLPIESLGFSASVPFARVSDDGHGGHDVEGSPLGVTHSSTTPAPQPAVRGNYSGVWLSTYEDASSSGGSQVFTSGHFVVLLQHNQRITARSLPLAATRPGSLVALDLELDGTTVTGTWTEETASDGYYQGARYHGAIQMLVEPTGRRMAGKRVGFGREFDVNTGPWELRLMDSSTNKATLDSYNRPPE